MKKSLSMIAIILIATFAQAQTSKDQAFTQLNNLINKAKGQSFMDGVSGNTKTVSTQQFSEKTILTQTKSKIKKLKFEMAARYSEMQWPHLKNYYIWPVQKNDKLQEFRLDFAKDVKHEYFSVDENGDDKPSYFNTISVYILEKDKEEAERLINVIGAHFEKLR